MAMSFNKDLECAFRTAHPNGDCVKGFNDLQSAEEDTNARNARAKELKLDIQYTAVAKP